MEYNHTNFQLAAMTKKGPNIKYSFDLRGQAEKRIPNSMESLADMSVLEVRKIVHELHVHQIELEMQNDELRKTQMELTESHHKYTDLYDFAPVGYFTLDKKGHIIETNVTGAALLGSEKRSLIRQPFHRFIMPGHFSIFQSHLQMTIEIKSKQTCKLKLTRKDGSMFDALIDTTAVTDGGGNFDHYRSSVTDITDITKAEESLIRAHAEMEERVRERTAQLDMANREAQRHSQLLDLANDAILICDLYGNITYWNKGAEKLYGWSRNEAIGQNILSLLQTEPLLKSKDIRERFFRDGYWEGERLHTKKDGRKVTVHSRWTLQRDDKKKPVAFSEINRDITELKRKEKELHDTALYSRRLIEASLDPLVTISARGKIMDVNKAAEDATGIPRKRLIGSDFSDYFTDPEKARAGYEMVFSQGFVKDYPLAIRHTSGRTMEVLYNATTYKNDAGEVVGVFAAARDITELRTAQKALQESHDDLERRVAERTAKLEAVNKELESFSYSVSHDLRAPLRAIDGYARMILKKQGDKFDEDTLSKFNVIRSSAHMMGQLIDDLLTFSRLGRKEISMSKLDMHALINDVWKELRIINPDRNMFLTLQGLPSGYGDRSLVKQVYSNLLGNAVKFTKYREAAYIEAGGYTDGNEGVYYIKDNGVGFDMTYYDKLFGVFQRLHSTDDFEGTGVGLATVQRIIRRHGGRVWAEGGTDRGATFYFTLRGKE